MHIMTLGGRLSSLLTNYDQTVITLTAAALTSETSVRLPCTALPWRGVGVQRLSVGTQDYLAAVNTLLITAKLRDDQEDEGRLRSRVGLRALRRQEKLATAALHRLGFPVSILLELPARQSVAERVVGPSLMRLAEPSRGLGGQVFAFLAVVGKMPGYALALRRLGEAMTTWVYLWDAVIDAKPDLKHGRFNALAAVYGWDGAMLQDEVAKHEVHQALHDALDKAQSALEELPGATTEILAALIRTLTAKTNRRFGSVPLRCGDLAADRRAEAGDLDCSGCVDCGGGGSDCSSCDCSSCCYLCSNCGDGRNGGRRQKREPKGLGETFDPNGRIGLEARVAKALNPEGRIECRAVEFDAVAVDEHIPAGAQVIIEGFEKQGEKSVYRVRLLDDS